MNPNPHPHPHPHPDPNPTPHPNTHPIDKTCRSDARCAPRPPVASSRSASWQRVPHLVRARG